MYKIPKARLIILRVIICFIIFFAMITTLTATFCVVYTGTYVQGTSMAPTLNVNYSTTGLRDKIYINRFNKGKVGDIVVLDLRNDINFGNYAVKRLVAVEGDMVKINYNNSQSQFELIVNDNVVQLVAKTNILNNTYESFKQYLQTHKEDASRVVLNNELEPEGVRIKSGEIFVLGDNWYESKDSSLVGPISKKSIVGRVDIVIKPNQNEFLAILKGIF